MRTRTSLLAGASAAVVFVVGLGACSPPGASTVPLPSITVPSVEVPSLALPSIDASAAASAAGAASAAASVAADAALAALDQVDAAITANTSATGISTDDATLLKQLTGAIRTSLQNGDTAGARAAVDQLGTEAGKLATKLGGPAGQQLTTAIDALKAAISG